MPKSKSSGGNESFFIRGACSFIAVVDLISISCIPIQGRSPENKKKAKFSTPLSPKREIFKIYENTKVKRMSCKRGCKKDQKIPKELPTYLPFTSLFISSKVKKIKFLKVLDIFIKTLYNKIRGNLWLLYPKPDMLA